MPPSDLPELSWQPSQSCQRQCPPRYKGDGNQGLALDRKEELKKDFSQEKWFTRLNMSDALVASIRIEREEKKKSKKDSGKKLGREEQSTPLSHQTGTTVSMFVSCPGNQRPRQPHRDPQHNRLLGSEQG